MFRLLRYFSLTSLASIVVAAAVLGVFYREVAVRSLVAMGESNNTALTRAFANSLWPMLWPYLATADTLPTDRLRSHPGKEELSAAVKEAEKGGVEDRRLAASLYNLGHVYVKQKKYADAETSYKRSLSS